MGIQEEKTHCTAAVKIHGSHENEQAVSGNRLGPISSGHIRFDDVIIWKDSGHRGKNQGQTKSGATLNSGIRPIAP